MRGTDIDREGTRKAELRPDIQALRGIAVLLVVLYHAGLGLPRAGYLGVDIFFVISGFLITGLIVKQIDAGSFTFASFYYRRAKRLLPAAYVVLLLVMCAAPLLVSAQVLEELRAQIMGALTFTANIVLWQQSGYFDGAATTKPLLHFWSLAVEEQFYFLMPALLVFTPKRWRFGVVLAILVLSAALCAYILTIDQGAAFYLLPTRAWQLALGSIGALVVARTATWRGLSWLRLIAVPVLFAIPFVPLGGPHPGVDSALVCLATLLIILGRNGNVLETSLPVRSLAWVGNISYSLYLVHWPMFVFVRAVWAEEPPLWANGAALAASFVLSYALYWLIEEPFRRGFQRHRIVLVGSIVTASAALVATNIYLTTPNNPATAFVRQTLAGTAQAAVPDALASADFRQILRRNVGLSQKCRSMDTESGTPRPLAECMTSPTPGVVVWGDSNAMMWGRAIADGAGDMGVAQTTRMRCWPMYGVMTMGTEPTPEEHTEAIECLDFNSGVFEFIRNTPSIEVVVLSSAFTAGRGARNPTVVSRVNGEIIERSGDADEVVRAFAHTARELRALGKRVVVLAPPPKSDLNTGECHERRVTGQIAAGENADCVIYEREWRDALDRKIGLLEQINREADIPVIWLSDFLCVDGICRTRIGDHIMYRDAGHISVDGAAYIEAEWGLTDRLLRAAR